MPPKPKEERKEPEIDTLYVAAIKRYPPGTNYALVADPCDIYAKLIVMRNSMSPMPPRTVSSAVMEKKFIMFTKSSIKRTPRVQNTPANNSIEKCELLDEIPSEQERRTKHIVVLRCKQRKKGTLPKEARPAEKVRQ